MLVPNRHGSSNSYRYGFQGQEKDDEIKGEGNSLNYTFRMHDPRVGRFFAVDPLTHKYPHYTPYSFSGNKVIHAIELEGLEEFVITTNTDKRLRHFKVRPDDNLSVISKVTGVAVNDIIKWNEKALNGNPDLIYAGQTLKLFDDTGLTMKYFVRPKQSNWVKDFVVQLATTNEHGPSIQSSAEAVLIAEGGAGVAEIVINAPKIIRGVTEVAKKLKPSSTKPKTPVTEAAPKISAVDDAVEDLVGFRRDHIINRHKSGAGKPGKTEFPSNWDDDKIINEVNKIANNPNAPGGVGKWDSPYKTGTVDGIEIRVDFYPSTHPTHAGKVSTAYPTNTPPNPTN